MLFIQNLTKARIDKKFLEKVSEKTLKIAGAKQKTEISLVIVSNKKIKELNKKYRGIDQATDVLSFGKTKKFFIEPPDKILHLGEIFISYQKAKTQAIQHRHSIKKEIAFLFIHGILHLLGYDHARKNETKEMKDLEDKILSSLFKK
jgi:probable rRNA maturation factor